MISREESHGYEVVCPLAEKDVESFFKGLDLKYKNIDVKRFVVLGNKRVGELIEDKGDARIRFVEEDQFISYDDVKGMIGKASSQDEKCMKRTGWYLQQFLKFSYALICDEDYYLLWDADTIPIHEHIMIEDNHPVFDMKTEHHEPYFTTFGKMFPNYDKRNSLSYISEHMLIKTSVMRELIDEIKTIDIPGESWHEKIINAVDHKDLPESGFSDYETYGLYCLNRYPELYIERRWNSLRPASAYFEFENMRERDYEWLRKDYDAVSFEAGWKLKNSINRLCTNSFVQRHFSCKKLLTKILHQFTI